MGGPGSGRKKGSGTGPKSAKSKMFIGSTPGSRARVQASMDAGKAKRKELFAKAKRLKKERGYS